MKNPYYFSNWLISIITIVSGVLVLISDYPEWLKVISYIFPFYELVNFIRLRSSTLELSFVIALGWLIIGIVCYVVQIKAVLDKKIHQY
ncbi:hypothetical protein, partial [Streptomyces scabiei]